MNKAHVLDFVVLALIPMLAVVALCFTYLASKGAEELFGKQAFWPCFLTLLAASIIYLAWPRVF